MEDTYFLWGHSSAYCTVYINTTLPVVSFLLPSNVPWFEYDMIFLVLHLLKDICKFSSLGMLRIKIPLIFSSASWCEHYGVYFSISGISVERCPYCIGLACACSISWGACEQLPTLAAPFPQPPVVSERLFLCSLSLQSCGHYSFSHFVLCIELPHCDLT